MQRFFQILVFAFFLSPFFACTSKEYLLEETGDDWHKHNDSIFIPKFVYPNITFGEQNGEFCVFGTWPQGGPPAFSVCKQIPTNTDTIKVPVPYAVHDTVIIVNNQLIKQCLFVDMPMINYYVQADKYWIAFKLRNECDVSNKVRVEIERETNSPVQILLSPQSPLPVWQTWQNGAGTIYWTEGNLGASEVANINLDVLNVCQCGFKYRIYSNNVKIAEGQFSVL